MDFSKITDQYSSRIINALSIKENSAVYTAQNPDGGLFVLRIYDRSMPGYALLAGQSGADVPGGSGVPGGGEDQGGAGMPKVYSCRMEQGCCVVEEEYIDGISLQELIDGGEKMAPERAIAITSSVCRTLLRLHRKGIIHRDVKPEHVMLTPEGKLYLIDLDASMRILPEKKSDTRLLGTAGYAAPEQFGLNRSDVRTDIFAVGILLNLLLTGEHPAVVRFREGALGHIIETCTAINPQDRYQNMTELLEDLEKARGLRRAGRKTGGKTGGMKRPVVLAGVLCLVILLGTALLLGTDLLAEDGGRSSSQGAENGQIRTASFTTASYDTSEKNYILCKKVSKDTYTPISSAASSSRGTEHPALIFLAEYEDRTFYLLTEKSADTLALPVLNCYRELTQDSVAAEITRESDVRIGDGVYAVWQVQIDPAFEGAVRAGVSLNGKLTKYEFLDNGTLLPNFLWILDESYVPADFAERYDGDLIPFAQNPAGQTFADRSALEASALKLGNRYGPILKQINMSLTPYDDENAFFLVHPAGTSLQDTTTQLCAFDQEGAGFGAGGAGGGVFAKSVDSVFSYSPAGSVMVGGLEMQVTKVKMKEYRGHEDIQAVFTLAEEEGTSSGEGGTSSGEGPAHYAAVRLQMGMNIVVLGEGLTEQDVISIDSQANLLEKALGFTPLSQPLKFVKSGDRYEGFYPLACALISEEGQGRMLSLNVEIPDHCRIRDLTDSSGKSLAYVVEQRKGYVVTDADGNPLYDQEAISARGWKSGITGANAGTADDRVLMDVTSCVAVHTEDYAKDICRAAVGQGNTADFEAFLAGHDPDGNPNHAELRMSYMEYTIYFNPADDAARNEIVFHVTKS